MAEIETINRIYGQIKKACNVHKNKLPHSDRYEAWLNEAAVTFKNPEWAKRNIASFIDELRREEGEPEPAPLDPKYASEFGAAIDKSY